jgi:antitoxin YefM
MTTVSATSARTKWFKMIKDLNKSHRVYEITSKEGNVVLLSKDDYENLLETLEILSTPGLAKSIKAADKEIKSGKTLSMKEVFGD